MRGKYGSDCLEADANSKGCPPENDQPHELRRSSRPTSQSLAGALPVFRRLRLPSAFNLFSFGRRRIDLRDFTKAIGFAVVRTGDEGPADFGRIPSRHDTKARGLFCFDVAGRKILHRTPSILPEAV